MQNTLVVYLARILLCMSETVMIRARRETRDKLRELSQEEGTTAVELLRRLVQEHEDAKLMAWFDKPGAEAVAAVREDLGAWDATLMDGLDSADEFSGWR